MTRVRTVFISYAFVATFATIGALVVGERSLPSRIAKARSMGWPGTTTTNPNGGHMPPEKQEQEQPAVTRSPAPVKWGYAQLVDKDSGTYHITVVPSATTKQEVIAALAESIRQETQPPGKFTPVRLNEPVTIDVSRVPKIIIK